MNPNYGYQLYQAQRIRTHAEILADDVRRGRQAAAVSRNGRDLMRKVRASAAIALSTLGTKARTTWNRDDDILMTSTSPSNLREAP